MKFTRDFLLLALSLFMISCSSQTPQQQMLGQPVPYLKLTMLDGTPRILDEYKGRTVALMFWATWCPRSRRAIVRLNDFAQSHRSSSTVFVADSIDKLEDEPKLKEKIKELGVKSLDHAFSGNETYDEAFMTLSGNQVPYFVIVDPAGTVIYQGDDEDKVFEMMSRPRRSAIPQYNNRIRRR